MKRTEIYQSGIFSGTNIFPLPGQLPGKEIPTGNLVFHQKYYFQVSEKYFHVSCSISKSYKSFFKKSDPTWSYDTPLQNAPSPSTIFSPEKLTAAQEHTHATHW